MSLHSIPAVPAKCMAYSMRPESQGTVSFLFFDCPNGFDVGNVGGTYKLPCVISFSNFIVV